MRIVQILLLVSAVVCSRASFAQKAASMKLSTQEVQAIHSFVTGDMARNHIPGVAVGVYRMGTVLLAKGYGLANVELDVPVKPETVFESGSVGKQFVAAAVMLLAEEGKLSLDDSITKYFPTAPESWKPILVKNLLSHTSGLPDYDSRALAGPRGPFYLRLDFTENQLLKKIEAFSPEWAPGTRWQYSNTNYVLLGILIHKVSGMPYAEFLREKIFGPLGMKSTRVISQRDIIPNRASGYQIDGGGQLRNQAWVSPTFDSTADGSLYINVVDMAKWDAALYGTRLLSQSSLDRMWTVYRLNGGKPNPGDYGFGWEIRSQNGHRLLEHSGAWQGFSCDISRYPDDKLTVVVLTNLGGAHSDPAYMAHVIAGLVDAPLLPAKLSAVSDTRPEIKTKLENFLSTVVAGRDARPLMSASFARIITPTVIKQAQQKISALWPGGALTLVKRITQPGPTGPTISIFRLKKSKNAVLVVFALDRMGKVAMVRLLPNRAYE